MKSDWIGPYSVYGCFSRRFKPHSRVALHLISEKKLGSRETCDKWTFEIEENGLQSGGKSTTPTEKLRTMVSACKHPRVRVVSRHEDTEFVECLECGEVFDSEEFHDMQIEEDIETEDVSDDS
jgi:hypothetical protein